MTSHAQVLPARVAILGGRGMLGTDVAAVVARAGGTPLVYDLPEWDICCDRDLRQAVEMADAVVNCAAYTDVDGAESDPASAFAVNAEAVAILARTAAELGRYVIHISTDFVFSGEQERPYREDDDPGPVNAYGRSKLEGERAFCREGFPGAIVRLEWTYGRHGRNFVTKLLDIAATRKEIRMVADQMGSPTWTGDVARVLLQFLRQRRHGLYHFAARGSASRLEIARFILDTAGLERRLIPCRTAEFGSSARRPLNSELNCGRIDAILEWPRPRWQTMLAAFVLTQTATDTGGRHDS